MLCGRRLLLSQSPLSGWSTTASTSTAFAYRASYVTSRAPDGPGSDDNARPNQAHTQSREEELAKEETDSDLQDRPSATTPAISEDQSDSQALPFRKIALEGGIPPEQFHVYAKVPQRYRDLAASPVGRHSKELGASGTTQNDDPQLPRVQGKIASQWTEEWVTRVGERLGLRLSKRDAVYFKLPIAHQMGIKARDPRLSSPAVTWAALDERDKLARKVAAAKQRQEELATQGVKPTFLRRDLAEGKTLVSPAPESKTKSAQPAVGHMALASMHDGFGENRDKAPTGIRFTVRPTWLPADRSTREGNMFTNEEDKLKSPYEGATNGLPHQEHSAPETATTPTIEVPDMPAADAPSKLVGTEQTRQEAQSPSPKPRRIHQDIFGMLFPHTTEPDSKVAKTESTTDRKAKASARRREKLGALRGGIYKRLFPDDVPEEAAKQKAPPKEEDLVSSEDTLFVSLRNEIRNWIPEEKRKSITAPEPGEYGSHSTVLILSGLSTSLLDTDFYRILPEAKHIEGWAGGLVKVVQARGSLSLEPIGRYFLMFHSHPAANAYKAELLRLHSLSKGVLHSSTGTGPLADAPISPQPFLTDEEKAAVRSFTLCPPTMPLRINVRMWNTNLVREIANSANIADVVQALRPDMPTPVKVLVTVNTIPGTRAGTGGGLTTDELWLTLRDDGRERGTPWVLTNLKEGIMPVKMVTTAMHNDIQFRSMAVKARLDGPIYDEQDMLAEPPSSDPEQPFAMRRVTYDRPQTRAPKDDSFDDSLFLAPESAEPTTVEARREDKFNRFVLTFTQPAVARRFVRNWHKRAIWDAYMKQSVSIDATVMM